ncbi:Iron-sulfur assembly protein 1 [Trametes pubescens]|uniref:Iron-sulfur assembly protein 1 n=1 Tax=Trametes pubescens TaxID=154538 RepID=A0A1M2VK01_TRAPU|nr:Iron-sulfur assembly protein 1 [Trametes pubescens]
MSALSHDRPAPPPTASTSSASPTTSTSSSPTLGETPPVVVPSPSKPPTARNLSPDAASPQVAARPPPVPKAERPRPKIRAQKAAITLTSTAVERLRNLLKSPTPQMIRIGVRNKGCAGLSYHLEYVEKAGKFDEVVEQDGVKVLIDSKALFSIIGSEMDWKEDALRYA